MKINFGLKLALPYLVFMIGLIVWVMNSSGDTPILPALFIYFPWGFMFGKSFKGLSEFILPLTNVGINAVILYIVGRFFKKDSSERNN